MAAKRKIDRLQVSQDLFSYPDTSSASQTSTRSPDGQGGATRPAKKVSVAKAPASKPKPPMAGQPFLPGLSRRGRPRALQPISAVDRTAEHRRKRLAEGARRVEMILSPLVARGLDTLAAHYKEPRSDVVAALILKAVAKVLKQPRSKPGDQGVGQGTNVDAT